MEKNRILLFIPMYNCEKQIKRVLNQLDNSIIKYIDEVIVVNNLSTDDGELVVQEFLKKAKNITVSLLRNKENYGLGGSHKVAFKYAVENDFDYIIVLHGDDQGNIHDIKSILKNGEYTKYDAYLGSRFMKRSSLLGYSSFRTFGNKIYNFIFSICLRKKICDLGSGLNIYKVESLKENYYHRFPDNLTFNCYMLLASKYYKHNIDFFPISWREDDQVSNVKMMNQAFKTLGLVLKYVIKPRYIKNELREKRVSKYEADIIYTNKRR